MTLTKNSENLIIPPNLAIRALRDSGYKNTAYALAELIDNSIQANASIVELICVETHGESPSSTRKKLVQIATLDNGHGMGRSTLSTALQFGNGTRLKANSGIGRFGMGLPNSSISQCQRLDVWTWTNGPDNAIHSYLDVAKIESGEIELVPAPTECPVPKEWRARSQVLDTRGTLVVWSNFRENRLTWKTAAATIRNTEEIVGRMYRKFIDEGEATVNFITVSPDGTFDRQEVRVNDPMYLMSDSTTPPPFDTESMFDAWGEDSEFDVEYRGQVHKVTARFSWAKQKSVPSDGGDRGHSLYGQHAKKNAGLSIVRERRELDLDTSWIINYDSRERWWGAEIEFPAALDDLFGVTINKQYATVFSQLAGYEWQTEASKGETLSTFCERLRRDGDPRGYLLQIAVHINTQIDSIRRKVKLQGLGGRSTKRHDVGVADRATKEFRKRDLSGHSVPSDKERFTPKSGDAVKANLIEAGIDEGVAEEMIDVIRLRGRKVEFIDMDLDGHAFFDVKSMEGGITYVRFNTSHPFHKELLDLMDFPTVEGNSNEVLLKKVKYVLYIVFAAWARYEIEEAQNGEVLFDIRQEWGKMVKEFLKEGIDS